MCICKFAFLLKYICKPKVHTVGALADTCTRKIKSPLPNVHFPVSSVQSLSRVWLFATPWTAACQDSLFITNSQNLLKLMSIELMMPSKHLILCHPLLLPPSIFPSIRVFSSESVLCIRWPKYWSFSFSICPSSEHSGLISFRIDWLDLLAVQGTLESLLQHHSSKASILWRFTFPYKVYWLKGDAMTSFIFLNFYCSTVTVQCYVSFCCTTNESAIHTHVSSLF